MFKTLITTCLLTFSSCTGIGNNYQHKDTRNNAVGFNNVYGTYVLRDDFTSKMESFYENHTNNGYYSLNISFELYNNDVNALYYQNGNLTIGDFQSLTIGIQRNSGDVEDADVTFLAQVNDTETIITKLEVPDVPFSDCYDLSLWISNHVATNNISGVVDESIMYHTVYFNTNVNLTSLEYELFDIFYTNVCNSYNTYYNGWYHCVNAITGTYFNDFFQCQIIVDNVLNNFIGLSNTQWYAVQSYDDEVYTYLYNGGWKITDMNVFINGMIPNNAYTFLSTKGTFSYVQPQPISDFSFQDFFFGIADTPLYYAWSLLNWDLFGLNLFVAFCGLCTLALVVFVIKKLI